MRKLVLASTGPKGAPGMESWPDDVVARLVTPDAPGPEQVLHVFYADTPTSQEAGGTSLGRGGEAHRHHPARPDASHGAIFQYATQTVAETLEFLNT